MEDFLRHIIQETIGEVLSESMDMYVSDFDGQESLDTLGEISSYIRQKSFHPTYYEDFSDEEKKAFRDVAATSSSLTPDGGEYFEETGTINFYLVGFPKRWIEKFLARAKYELSERDVIMGEPRREGDRVIRIPIVENNSETFGPPEVNFSNTNARLLFEDVLDLKLGEGYSPVDVLMRIGTAIKKLPTMSFEERPSMTGGGQTHYDKPDIEYIERSLERIKKFAEWAHHNGSANITMM